jgi:hypothetical protein
VDTDEKLARLKAAGYRRNNEIEVESVFGPRAFEIHPQPG